MTSQSALKLQQSPLGTLVPECWKLAPDRALTLRPESAGVLRIAQGRVWATVEGPHQGPANDWGDVVLRSGQQLQLLPGQQVVVEVYGEAVNEAAYFSWEPVAATSAQPGLVFAPWGDVLARPLWHADRVLPKVAAVLGRSVLQLGRMLSWLVPGRGRVLMPMESNQP